MFDGGSNNKQPDILFSVILAAFFAICAIASYKNGHFIASISECSLVVAVILFTIGERDQEVLEGEVPPGTVAGLIVGIIGAATLVISIFA